MRISSDAIIADEKLRGYLLVQRPWDDKSGFLRQAGFGLGNWTELRDAIREAAASSEAIEEGASEYGTFYRVNSVLMGPGGPLRVKLIWIRRASDLRYSFVTLVPWKE